jgi:hypothetical protein
MQVKPAQIPRRRSEPPPNFPLSLFTFFPLFLSYAIQLNSVNFKKKSAKIYVLSANALIFELQIVIVCHIFTPINRMAKTSLVFKSLVATCGEQG